jgi:hypothetical protein
MKWAGHVAGIGEKENLTGFSDESKSQEAIRNA